MSDSSGQPTVDVSHPRSDPDSLAELAELAVEPGSTINGRYLVIDEIGRGGMGVVLRGYDPRLHREVALKGVRADQLSLEGRVRLVEEARALASLSHPNVVQVYDAEIDDGDQGAALWVVMEYVPGRNLHEWLADGDHASSEILEHFRAAGRGLVAAHAAGILHRDFKPANVLLGSDGRVRVVDFGIAQRAGQIESVEAPSASSVETGVALTRPGHTVGTPSYMAPEQARGESLNASTDQYAFCVSLWEGLTGSRPFRAMSDSERLAAKMEGPPRWPKDDTPRAIAAAIRKGLDPDPERRWPSMAALLSAVESRTSRRSTAMVWSGLGIAAVAALVLTRRDRPASAEACTGAEEALGAAWNHQRRADVEKALNSTGAEYAGATWDRIGPDLDDYAGRWVSAHTEVCKATAVEHTQPMADMDLRMSCLRRARLDFDAVTHVLTTADRETVRKADEMVTRLPALARCDDLEGLRRSVPPPAKAEAAAVEEIRASVAEARALRDAGRYPEALGPADEARERLRSVEYAPVHAEVAAERGTVLELLAKWKESEEQLADGLRLALRSAQWDRASEIANRLSTVAGDNQQSLGRGLAAARVAGALARRGGDPLAEANWREARAKVLHTHSRFEEAEREQLAVLSIRSAELGDEDSRTVLTRFNLANIYESQGRYAEAEQEHRKVLTRTEAMLGAAHPESALSRNNLGSTLWALGRFEDAQREYQQALLVWEAALGRTHPNVLMVRNNIAVLLHDRGQYAEAVSAHQELLERELERFGPTDVFVANTRNNLSNSLRRVGRLEDAEVQIRAAIDVSAQILGPEHRDVGESRANLGAILQAQGRHAEADRELGAALEIFGKTLGRRHPFVGRLQANWGGSWRRAATSRRAGCGWPMERRSWRGL